MALSTLAGTDGAEIDAADALDFDQPIEMDLELVDPNHGQSTPRQLAQLARVRQRGLGLSLMLSLKFWTFGACFFGLTGITLSILSALPALGIALISGGMGILSGGVVAGSLHYLRRHEANSLISSADVEGALGTVEIPFDATSRGTVRLWVGGSSIDFSARTHHQGQLQPGESVLVVEMQEGQVWVVPQSSLNLPSPPELPS